MSATDILRTVLELENNVSAPAMAASAAIEEVGEDAALAAARVDDLGDEMLQTSGISAAFAAAMREVASGGISPFNAAVNLAGDALGNTLAPMLAKASALMAGPGGLVVGAVAATGAIFATAGAVGFLGQALATLSSGLAAVAPLLGPAAGVAITAPFLEAAKGFDSNIRLFQAILGSKDKAQQMTGFLESYGMKSGFSSGPLTEATKTLALGGKDVNRFLPVAESIAIFGGGNDEAMTGVSDVLRRLMGGQIADALGPDGLGRFGINRKMLEGAGATFDKSGRFQGDENKALEVLETLTKTNQAIKDARGLMEGSIASITSNFWDAINKNARLFGETMGTYVLPIISQTTEGLVRLANSGAIQNFANQAARMLGLKGEIGSSFNTIAAGFMAMMETALAMAKNGFAAVRAGLEGLGPFLDRVQSALDAAAKVPGFGAAFIPAALGFRAGREAFNAAGGALGGIFEGDEKGMSGFDHRFKKYFDKISKAEGPKDQRAPTPGENQLVKAQEAQVEALTQIERNTRVMAEASIKSLIMGGGQLGAMGVTPFEVNQMKGRIGSDPIETAVLGMVDAIATAMAQRQGAFITNGR